MSGLIVTVTPTIMDGQVVRWYGTEYAAEHGNEKLSASRNGVQVNAFAETHGDRNDLLALIGVAFTACDTIRKGGDVGHLATHTQRFASRTLTPVDGAA